MVERLLEADRARVVVCFCEGMTIRNLVRAAARANATQRLLFLGRWGTSLSSV